ncbi:hypothetical protein [[Clostridium] hylemonae]|uniref:Uncharacterized protein n=1 Tax=[Clostridium] hylemonae DSM 15053 TaxID=553973 RepID=C0C5Q0_9FIRM|nr:hypothetical protein [[Clostridium] hylemonae]EEG72434.1 hypothetical protein CLOHYLEM_07437 [[Clostridium] hylemonae DSM 15053]QEK16610.1 hypothetical protein LAJLEIBI_00611 [[Clostridium] hylemonae DSM 15053]
MKEKLKYAVGALLACSLVAGFMPLIEVGAMKMSVMDILKIGVGTYGDTELIREVMELFKEYLRPSIITVVILIILILAGAFLTVVLDASKAYIAALVSGAVNNVLVIILCVSVKGKIDEVESAFNFFGLSSGIRFHVSTIVLWILLYAVIFGLSACGIVLGKSGQKTEGARDIMPENLSDRKNPWEADLDPKKQAYLERIGQLEQERKAARKATERAAGQTEGSTFHGAIGGRNGRYASKVYPLQEKVQVFFIKDGTGEVLITGEKSGNTTAGVYYISEYEEYCVEPYEKNSFFLTSGQPLGRDRRYHLPRGTEVYIGDRGHAFVLA